ncbi:MAG TPA: hypothetical protein PKD99_03135 [Sphingopyxis sp.]|nr:hypothetical protein [Sphingopyxis sp.]HMP44074.1 hypothetical protein [Sphingopyxis sp.]
MSSAKPFWTIGKERERAYAAKFVKELDQQKLIFPVIDAAIDINDGVGDEAFFIELARVAMTTGNAGAWQNVANWIRKVGALQPTTFALWDELSEHPNWQIRWRVACVLYHDIPDPQSDRLFAVLRHDKSAKVRDCAISRYENRPGADRNVMFKMFDADDPASPGFRRG